MEYLYKWRKEGDTGGIDEEVDRRSGKRHLRMASYSEFRRTGRYNWVSIMMPSRGSKQNSQVNYVGKCPRISLVVLISPRLSRSHPTSVKARLSDRSWVST